MRRLLCLTAVLLVLAACDVGTDPPDRVLAAATISELSPAPSTTTTTAAPAPPPPICDDYANLEQGRGDARNQQWYNGLHARDGDKGYERTHVACVYGWGGDEFAALDELWQLEADGGDDSNGHDWHAWNVPQAKPFSKMGCATWDHRCQDRWGAAYISERYGTPSAALRAWRARSPHWY